MNIKETIQLLNEDFFLLNDAESIEMYIEGKCIDRESVQNKSLTYNPATQSAISDKEKSLGVQLPPSYIEFLLLSNGFKIISPFLDNLFPVEKIDWTKNLEEKWWLDMYRVDASEVSDEQYFYYEEDQDPALSRDSYIPESLKISEWFDGMCVFLNPVIKFGKEWEVLESAMWYPGIRRYKSFREYLWETHKSNRRLLERRNK